MVSKTNIQTDFYVPTYFDESIRLLIGKTIIEYILRNTENGVDSSGKKFHGYSQSYIHSQNFRNAHKHAAEVNLHASGDMLAELDVITTRPGVITIGYKLGSSLAGQVEGIQKDQHRHFIGLPKAQMNLIIAKYESDYQKEAAQQSLVSSLADSILKRLGV